ncbi:MAG TPA: NAD(P)/FAD-dependent oxidoreductase, partial [Actinomycetota bacterium]|nr:NAD(P)/FAD-dependent oxidoreductase [Actinomycetota bacterium]
LDQVLLDAGGGWGTEITEYDELVAPEQAEALTLPIANVLPGVPGSLCVGHPDACRALAAAATKAGARVLTGIERVRLTDHGVRFELDEAEHRARGRIIIGADGRQSVVRRQAGISMRETMPRTVGGGVLVGGVEEWPEGREAMGTEGDRFYLLFPRPGGIVRLYLLWDIAARNRFSTGDRTKAFLEAYRFACMPNRDVFADALPLSPFAAYPMNDSMCDDVATDGVVLIGDAAGWNDPILGQGLSISMRDVRSVSQVLLNESDWSPAAFAGYAEERRERMTKLGWLTDVVTDLRCTFTDEGRERRRRFGEMRRKDPSVLMPFAASLVGPERIPAEHFSDELRATILSL